jgi:hypothetical protein
MPCTGDLMAAMTTLGVPILDEEGVELTEDTLEAGVPVMYVSGVPDDDELSRVFIPGVGMRSVFSNQICLV